MRGSLKSSLSAPMSLLGYKGFRMRGRLVERLCCLCTGVFLGFLAASITGCTSSHHAEAGRTPQISLLSPAASVGKQLFFDPSLSASGKLACATCHDPRHAYGPPNDRAVQLGGPDLTRLGTRAVPSLRYTLDRTPRWTHVKAFSEVEQLTETDSVPTGGFAWDGRFDTLRAQALFPLLAPNEMANRSVSDFAARLAHTPYAGAFTAAFGKDIFRNPVQTVEEAAYALERFELEDKSFHPFSSEFDAWMDGKVNPTAQQLRGKQLFDDPMRGNCSSCHRDDRGADGSHPIFTDFQFEALGVPRNSEIPANANPGYFDMGLCGPLRTDAAGKEKTYCGLFKTPTLRNVTIRGAFFHNGRFHSLKEALRFYVQRDTNPDRWYPAEDGRVDKFDDLPSAYHDNIDVVDAPLNLSLGQVPVWNDQNIEDVVAFLRTLEDRDVVRFSK
jgi:cytochrome c peroxidase